MFDIRFGSFLFIFISFHTFFMLVVVELMDLRNEHRLFLCVVGRSLFGHLNTGRDSFAAGHTFMALMAKRDYKAAPKSASNAVFGRMPLTLHATRGPPPSSPPLHSPPFSSTPPTPKSQTPNSTHPNPTPQPPTPNPSPLPPIIVLFLRPVHSSAPLNRSSDCSPDRSADLSVNRFSGFSTEMSSGYSVDCSVDCSADFSAVCSSLARAVGRGGHRFCENGQNGAAHLVLGERCQTRQKDCKRKAAKKIRNNKNKNIKPFQVK